MRNHDLDFRAAWSQYGGKNIKSHFDIKENVNSFLKNYSYHSTSNRFEEKPSSPALKSNQSNSILLIIPVLTINL